METLRSLRHVTARAPKPGSSSRTPVTTAARVLATSGVLISALVLVGAGAAEAATGGQVSGGSHVSAHSTKAGHSAKAHSTKANRPNATQTPIRRPGPWIDGIITARGPWLW
jgi:hypothetical protein